MLIRITTGSPAEGVEIWGNLIYLSFLVQVFEV
jgi:hypothetical protein